MTFKDISPDGKKFRFKLYGSLTGDDGEGSPGERFVSQSGRITIEPDDWLLGHGLAAAARLAAGQGWSGRSWATIAIRCSTRRSRRNRFEYVTVADGLPPGEHELTLIPDGTGSFSIHAVEAYNPPMAGK